MAEIEQWLRMGTHAESDYFVRARGLYDGLVLNANLVEATTGATSLLVVRVKRPYMIDPITFAFALDPSLLRSESQPRDPDESPRARATFNALAEAYSLPIADRVGIDPIRPSDLTRDRLAIVVDKVLQYQSVTLRQALDENADFVGSPLHAESQWLTPARIVAPYFVDDASSRWREINLQMIGQTVAQRRESAAGMVAFDATDLNDVMAEQLARHYGQTGATTLWTWPADLDEHSSATSVLGAYAFLVQRLTVQGVRVLAAYGGFFALLLTYSGLAGLSHGLGYGDKRRVEPVVGGGLPPARYYLWPLRDSVSMATFAVVCAGLTDAEYRTYICSCPICDGLLRSGGVSNLIAELTASELRPSPSRGMVEVATPRVYRMSRFHFLFNRRREVELMRAAIPYEELSQQLMAEGEWVAERIGWNAVRHLERWIRAATPPASQ